MITTDFVLAHLCVAISFYLRMVKELTSLKTILVITKIAYRLDPRRKVQQMLMDLLWEEHPESFCKEVSCLECLGSAGAAMNDASKSYWATRKGNMLCHFSRGGFCSIELNRTRISDPWFPKRIILNSFVFTGGCLFL
jgi:hypothetical protein